MSLSEENPIPIIGYCDRLSVQPDETIRFMVSSDYDKYRADIVRIVHADENPKGPGFKEELVSTTVSAEYPGKKEHYPQGSCVVIPLEGGVGFSKGFTIQAWIYSTTPKKGTQGILTNWDNSRSPVFGLFIDEAGAISLALRDSSNSTEWISTGKSLHPETWYLVGCSYDPISGKVTVRQESVHPWPANGTNATAEKIVKLGSLDTVGSIVIGAAGVSGVTVLTGMNFFNGKIDKPALFSRVLNEEEFRILKSGAPRSAFGIDVAGDWDFSQSVETDRIVDLSGFRRHGKTVNNPKRAVTVHNWTGREVDFRRALDEYGAIHFHEDDLDDCKWNVDFEFTIPSSFKSGIYAAKLSAGEHTDYIPFFVRPRRGTSSSRIAFLVPTLSYLAYGNDHAIADIEMQTVLVMPEGFKYPNHRIDKYLVRTNLLSLYDKHLDRSGVCYVSRLRPILTMRPDYKEAVQSMGKGSPHQFPADLWITYWMEMKGFQYDIITDEDLHWEGTSILEPYKVIVTGTHPEYWTAQMLDAMELYLNSGGRLMYMGGNGFYWVTSTNSCRPQTFEVRRWGGTQAWRSPPGEYYHNTTGDLGGLWKNRGRAPQKLVGIGFTSQGWASNRPYLRLKDSFDQRAAFIFEGIERDEVIGDFDNLDQERSAAGYEFDRLDYSLGTPRSTLLLATANGFSDGYQFVVEELDTSDSKQGGSVNDRVRADMTYLEYENQGAVFCTGSVTWSGCLSYNNFENNVSRITENVLRKFSTVVETA